MASMNDIIELNVGGVKFETTRQTLLHDPESMLAKMFDPVSPLCPAHSKKIASGVRRDGAYFLDRDPVHFRCVLNYLRSGQVSLDKNCSISALLVEASYFGLSGLEASLQERLKDEEKDDSKPTNSGDEFLLNVGGEVLVIFMFSYCRKNHAVFVTTRETLCKYSNSRLANIVEGRSRQLFDKNGILFLDEDPKDFVYILRALRNAPNVPTAVPKETIDNILNLRDNLEIREIKFGYREQSNSFVSEYFLSICR